MKEVLQSCLHILESPRSGNGDGTLLPPMPETANRPVIAAVDTAEKVEKSVFDRGYHIIVRE
jgi:hypothetical protein